MKKLALIVALAGCSHTSTVGPFVRDVKGNQIERCEVEITYEWAWALFDVYSNAYAEMKRCKWETRP